jgi:hypothetical protein
MVCQPALWCVCVPYAFEAAAPPPSSPTPPPHSSSSSSSFSTFSSPPVRHTLLSFHSRPRLKARMRRAAVFFARSIAATTRRTLAPAHNASFSTPRSVFRADISYSRIKAESPKHEPVPTPSPASPPAPTQPLEHDKLAASVAAASPNVQVAVAASRQRCSRGIIR